MNDNRGLGVPNGHTLSTADELRMSLDRRRLLIAIASALLFHLLIVFGFLIADRIRIRDIGDWSGPVLVKIGVPDAQESPQPDPGPLPDIVAEQAVEAPEANLPQEISEPEGGSSLPDNPTPSELPVPETQLSKTSDTIPTTSQTSRTSEQPKPLAVPAARPSRVRGNEQGNSYEINFDGTDDEVGRAGAYEFITSYMPLPEMLDSAMVNAAKDYLGMSGASVRAEIERYWEPVFGEYVKKKGNAGVVPLDVRPYYWSLLVQSLGYDVRNADWKSSGMRPVVVEFSVQPSQDSSGASLSDFKMISRTTDPRVDEAVIYGLSRWVYFNKTDKTVRGRITYNFDR